MTPKNLYNLFKKFFDNECKDTESCLKDLLRYSKFFHGIIFNEETDFDKLSALDKKFYELFHLLDAKKSPIILMYLLNRYEQQHFDEATFIKFVDALISLAFRAKVCKRSGITQQFAGNVLARLDKEIALDTNKFWRTLIDSSSVTFPSDRDFQESLINARLYESIKSDGCKYLLYSLERAARAKELPSYAEATVEHVFPQKPNDSWKKYLKERNDYQTTEGLLHTLGNLTLTAYNSELGNGDFDAKKEIYAQSNFSYTRALTNYAEWTSKQIQSRAKKLADLAIKIWMLPDEFNSRFANVGDTFNLDSDFGLFTGTKPANVSISETTIKISNWIGMLREVVKQLYILDKDIFRQATHMENLPRKNKLFSIEPQILQKPFKVDENYYMENRLSTEDCLKIIKCLAENFDQLCGTTFKEEIYFTLRR